MLQEGFSIGDDDVITDELNQLECYRTENGVVISAIRAAQIIYEWVKFMYYTKSPIFSADIVQFLVMVEPVHLESSFIKLMIADLRAFSQCQLIVQYATILL